MWKSTKFKDYIRNTFIFYAIIIIILIFILFITSMLFNFQSTVIKTNNTYNNLLVKFIDNQFSEYEKSIRLLSKEKDIIEAVSNEHNLSKANNLLYLHGNKQNIKANFALLDKNGYIIATSLYKKNQEILSTSNVMNSIIISHEKNFDKIYKDINNMKFDESQKSNFMFSKAVYSENEIIGYLIYWLKDEDFSELTRYKDVDIVIMADTFNNSIFSTNDIMINNMGKISLSGMNNNLIMIDKQIYYIITNEIKPENFKIITMTSIQKHKEFLIFGIILLIVISLFMVILVTILSPRITKRNLASFDSLIFAIQQLKDGNIDHRIQSKTFDEFQDIYHDFNTMMSRIQSLIKSNYEIAERKRQMEIKHLEGQFNPHFVFNVMEMIRYEVLLEPEMASNLVVSFANLMRYNLNYGSVEVLLKIDIEYIEDYLKIQKMRFGNRLSYSIDIEESLLECMIPKLILQPIIENSIKYGIENTDNLFINIVIHKSKDILTISLSDNGVGIEKEKLNNLNSLLQDEYAMPSNIGLYNAHRIIRLLYGKRYGLNITSEYGKGTIVVLTIPVIKSGDELNE